MSRRLCCVLPTRSGGLTACTASALRRAPSIRIQRFLPLTECGSNTVACETGGIIFHQGRCFQWNALKPENWSVKARHTSPEVDKELPEVFASQPEEVEDYIRPEKTLFEHVEDWWDWIISFMAPIEKQMDWMRGVAHNGLFGFDLGWGGTFVFWGVMVRLLTLIPQLYAHRNALRLGKISPQIGELNQLQKKLKGDKTVSTAEKRIIKEGYARMKKALYKKHNCSQMKSALQGASTPVLISAFMSIKRLATYDQELETAKFLWVTDLTMPDETWLLPICCSALFMLNFELNQMMNRGGRSANTMYMRWAVRVGTVVFLYFFQAQPSGLFCYWIGMSTVGLLQPLLLRSPAFRKYFDFPDPPAAVRAVTQVTPWTRLMIKLGRMKEPSREVNEEQEKEEQLKQMQRIHDFEVVFEEENREGSGQKGPAFPTK